MISSPFATVARLSDLDLLQGLEALLARKRHVEAELLAHLAEVDARKLYLERGFDSMYRYCVEALHLSESSAYHRIHAARAARKFPSILARVAEGRLHLSGIVVVVPHLTPTNNERLLDASATLSTREIEELVATLFPKAKTPAYVEGLAEELELPLSGAGRAAARGARRTPGPAFALPPRATVEPLRPELYKVQFTADRALRQQLDEVQALLRHQIPDGDLGEIFRRAIALLLEDTKRKRFAKTGQAEPGGPDERDAAETQSSERGPEQATPSRHIPAAIKREVYERDGGRCGFVAPDSRPA